MRASHLNAKKIAGLWISMGGKLSQPTETNMVWLDLEDVGIEKDEFVKLGKARGLRLHSGRLVAHYQISNEAIERLEEVMQTVMKMKGKKGTNGVNGANGHAHKKARVGEKVYGT